MFCSKCGAANQNENFCSSCGKKLSAAATPQQAQSKALSVDFAPTGLATKSLVWFGISVAWFVVWVMGFTVSSMQSGYVKPGLTTAMFIGLFIPTTAFIYGIRAWAISGKYRGSKGFGYLLTGGVLGTILSFWFLVTYVFTMVTNK